MCTLVVFSGVSSAYPLVIAANRDEVPSRPSAVPMDLSDAVFAPRDLRRGGTWIGFSRHGFAVAITNRDAGPRHGTRSRGLLVTDCLAATSREEAFAIAMRIDHRTYSGFHLIIADKDDAMLVCNEGDRLVGGSLGDGLHVITSFGTEAGHCARDALIRMHAKPEDADDVDALKRLLSFHGPGPEDGTCAHGDGVKMESIFSAIARLPASGDAWRLHWRSGRPCVAPTWSAPTVPLFGR